MTLSPPPGADGVRLTGETHGYDHEHPEWLAMDLRLLADNTDASAGYATANAQLLRVAAHQFDGLPNEYTADQARAHYRAALSTHPKENDHE